MEYASNAEIGVRIREMRDAAELSPEQLAELVNLDQSAICRIEQGKRNLSARELLEFGEALNTTGLAIAAKQESNEAILLRADDIGDEDLRACVSEYQSCIDDFFAFRAAVQ